MEMDENHNHGADLNNNLIPGDCQDSLRNRDGGGRTPTPADTMQPKSERTLLTPKRKSGSSGKNENKIEDNKKHFKMDMEPELVHYFENERDSSRRHKDARRLPGVKRTIDCENDDGIQILKNDKRKLGSGRNSQDAEDTRSHMSPREERRGGRSYANSEYFKSEFGNAKRPKIRIAPPRDDYDEFIPNSEGECQLERVKIQNYSVGEDSPNRRNEAVREEIHVSSLPYSKNSGTIDRLPFNQSMRQLPQTISGISSSSDPQRPYRPIIIDGSNVAFARSHGQYFDSKGIKICVDYFVRRGVTEITVVVPERRLRKRGCKRPQILQYLLKKKMLITCWSRKLSDGRWVSSYDDRMIIEIAHKRGGVIISNDQYRDLYQEKPEWRDTIKHMVLGFRFMPHDADEIMFPEDPFGRGGPSLDEMLRY